MEGVEQLREVSRTADARSGEEAGDRESPEFSHSAGEGLCEMPVSLRKDWFGAPGFEPGSPASKAGVLAEQSSARGTALIRTC